MKIASVKVSGYIDVEIPDHINDIGIAEDWIRDNVDLENITFDDLDFKCTYITDWGEDGEN